MSNFYSHDDVDISQKIYLPHECQQMRSRLRFLTRSESNRDTAWKSLTLFCLTFGAGLRRVEWGSVRYCDLQLGGERPYLLVRGEKGCTKAVRVKGECVYRSRRVPLWWDAGVLEDLRTSVQRSMALGAGDDWPLIHAPGGRQMKRDSLDERFRRMLYHGTGGYDTTKGRRGTHCGRHTFASIALFRGRTLREVSRALGHSSLGMTSRYVHVIETNSEDLYPEREAPPSPAMDGAAWPIPSLSKASRHEDLTAAFPFLDTAPTWTIGRKEEKAHQPRLQSLIG